MGDKGFSSHNI